MQLTSTTDQLGLAEEQVALRRLAELVASGASPTEVFAQVTTSASDVFGTPFASLIRSLPDGTATMVAGCEACNAYVGMSWDVPDDDPGITRTVLRTRRPAHIEDHSRVSGPVGEAARALGVGSVAGAPVVVDGTIWGVLVVGAPQDGPSLASDVGERLAEFTELVTTTLLNAEARENVRSLLNEQETLRRVATLIAQGASPGAVFAAVCDDAAKLFDTEMAAIGRFEVDEPALVTVGISAGVRGMTVGMRTELGEWLASTAVYRTGRTARRNLNAEEIASPGPIADAVRAMGFLSTVSAPIIVEGRLWGVMTVSDSRHALAPDTEQRIEKFTELIATAISNREARDKMTRLLDEQSSLRRVATLVAESPLSEELFSAVAREVLGVLEVSGVLLERFEADGGVLTLGTAYDAHLEGVDAFFGVGMVMPPDPGSLAAQVFETRRAARVDDYSSLPGTIGAAARAAGLGAGVAGPIFVDGELWGQMCVFSRVGTLLPVETENRLHDFIELLATAISNYEAHAALQRLADEQAALRRVATLVAQSPASEELFSAVAREVASVLHVPGVIVTHYEPDGTVVTFGEAFNSDLAGGERFFGVGSRTPRDPGSLAAQVFDTQRPARIDDFSRLEGTIGDAARAARLGSGCASPIVVDGEVWGKMCVFSGPGTVLPAGTENHLHEFIELVATAIANYEARADLAASESRAVELANEQAALRRIATLVAEGAAPQDVFDAVRREVAEVFDVPFTVLWRFGADGTATVLSSDRGYLGPAGTRWPIEGDTNIAARVLRTGCAARVDNTSPGHSPGSIADAVRRAGIRSGVGVPILVEGELWGTMTVGSEKALPAEVERRLERFTELLATAIANAKSRGEVTQLADEQAALRRVATFVAQGAEPGHVFAAVAKEVAGIIDIPVVGVHRYEADGTFTMLGIAGETDFTVGSRWPVEEDGVAGVILATGRPARKDETVGVPIVVEGSVWGFMVAAGKPGWPIPPDTEERLARFTELVATAVSNATTRTDLLTSRARVVSAADETRRRLERDLHDGIQQWLVALALKARKAARLSAASEPAVRELTSLADDLVAVTDELREISRGIHPAILSDAGLDDALEALARRSAIRVDLDVSFERRYDPALEATVYYVLAESITNAVKHAQASTVTVHGGLRGEVIELEIKDDGVGGADPRGGTGMIGLKDRVDTCGGMISFASPAGAGTTIRVKLPAREWEDPRLPAGHAAASAPASG